MKSPLIDRLITEKKGKPIILGHRGVRNGDVPENTLGAFEEAFKRGASGIEIDVESTLDGELIVINRWFLKSQFDVFPWEKSREEILQLARKKDIEIPTFLAVCQFIKKRENTIFNVEIKSSHHFICHTARKAIDIIRSQDIDSQVIISSFDMNTLLTTRFYHHTIETAYLFRSVDRVVKLDDKKTWRYKINSLINRTGIKGIIVGVDTLHPEISLFPENVDQKQNLWQSLARRMDKRVNAWTVETQEDLEKAMSAGARIVISDNVKSII